MTQCPHCQRQIDRLSNLHTKGLLQIGENVVIHIRDSRTAKLLEEQRIHNLVVNSGLTFIRDLIDETQQGISHFATGISSAAVAPEDTTLGNEAYRNSVSAREKVDYEITHRCFVAPSAANGSTLYEAGLFNGADSSPGQSTMFSRVVHDPIIKTISITITYAWTHTIGRA
jgi:hypothetical protein